ncbi:inositol-pentakisphosphate 2-kinase [Nitzschia inconspicua]|uniref:Inositol-pentakisphosphate 2-kinase n=1 Tax=Nitzschia inconspicua TaxID=303405 RepID=A0A9K3KMT5_9STRA|nr:inositol-pentakisphosphate 2-kinase [Nitzschia inconspicua]
MSHRALRRMRQEREPQFLALQDNNNSSDESSDDDAEPVSSKPSTAFAMIDDDDDDDDDDSSSSSKPNPRSSSAENYAMDAATTATAAKNVSITKKQSIDEQVDDWDALLQEYQLKDEERQQGQDPVTNNGTKSVPNYYGIITAGIDSRDLDIDHVMRTSFVGGNTGSDNQSSNSKPRSSRRGNRQNFVFGPPKDNWPRPPHYVGGGMGMASYDDLQKEDTNSSPIHVPMPYYHMEEDDLRRPPLSQWFQFTFSDSYHRDMDDFETIEESGDANLMAMFVAHHPFIASALLQLSKVLYQTRQNQDGLALLKRCLYVLECAALNSFLKMEAYGRTALMDIFVEENYPFFHALFLLMRVSHVAGLYRTALAVSRLLLSLDPLRDPEHVLLSMDYFALACDTESCDEWLVNLVESNVLSVFCEDVESEEVLLECGLLDMPNWSFSYALALFRIHQKDSLDHDAKEKADRAIQRAVFRFPTVVRDLFTKNEVDVNSRSFQTDWPSVLEFVNELIREFGVTTAASTRRIVAYYTIVGIFVQQNCHLWKSSAVLKWLYDNLQVLKVSTKTKIQIPQLCSAILRYHRCDPSNFKDTFETMPVEINPLEPDTVAFSLTIDTNRPRLLQRGSRESRGRQNDEDGAIEMVEDAAVNPVPESSHQNTDILGLERQEQNTAQPFLLPHSCVSSWEYLGEGGKHVLFSFEHSDNGNNEPMNPWKGKLLRIAKSQICLADHMCEMNQVMDPYGTSGRFVAPFLVSPQDNRSMQNDNQSLFYIRHIVAPYLSPFVDVPDTILLTWQFLKDLREKALLSGRIPTSRQSDWEAKEADGNDKLLGYQPCAILVVDYRNIQPSSSPSFQQSYVRYSIELKPKAGYLAFSPLVEPKHRVKYRQSRFRSLQQLHQQGHWTKGWAKGDKQVNYTMSLYDPLDLFSGQKSRIEKAVTNMYSVPQNNLGIWCNDERMRFPQQDLSSRGNSSDDRNLMIQALLVEILCSTDAQDLLRQVQQWQRLDVLDVDGAVLVYQRLVKLCESKEAAENLLDQVPCKTVTRVDDKTTPALPALESSPFQFHEMDLQEQNNLRVFCQTISDFRDWLNKAVQEHTSGRLCDTPYMDSTRGSLLALIEHDLSKSACVFLLRNWLLSLMMCDVGIFIAVEECREWNGSDVTQDNTIKVVTIPYDGGTRCFRYSLHVIDVDPKPAKKLRGRSEAEAAFQFLN